MPINQLGSMGLHQPLAKEKWLGSEDTGLLQLEGLSSVDLGLHVTLYIQSV